VIMRRMMLVGGLVVLVVAAGASRSLADDLSDYLEEAGDAIYSGQRLVGTTWDGIERVGMIEVQHHGGVESFGAGSDHVMVGAGRMHVGDPDDAAFSFVLEPRPDLGTRYTVENGEATRHLGRPATVVDVMEAGKLRIRMVVDDSTSAPVTTQVFDDAGDVFRYSSMVEFSVWVDPSMAQTDDREYRMMLPVEQVELPAIVAGYQLIDAYAAPDDGHQAFYTDGLFSFSVFTIDRRANWSAIADDELPYTTSGHSYLRVVTPTSVWVLWNAPATAMALVGDLPPDHLDQVLAELPRPGTENWLKRLWHRMFG
jgi:hypothetical protein